MANFEVEFRTPEQKEFFYLTEKNQMFSGGFGNGKTTGGCLKALYLLLTFPGYKVAIVRLEESKLRMTTMVTFFKVCLPEFYAADKGGNRADSANRLRLINGSEVIWMNLKDTDDGMIRGLEVNSILVDQAEEVSEGMWRLLAARVGRWDKAKVPQYLLDLNPDWPMEHGRHKVPNYMMGLCNPDQVMHWIYRRFHPDSEFYDKYKKNHKMIQGATSAATISADLLEEMMDNDPTWVDRFVKGKWGIPGGQIHRVDEQSLLTPGKDISFEFIEQLLSRGNLARSLDHGDSAPTCCLWFVSYKGNYFCYREYYKPNALISEHRHCIALLSGKESYKENICDPAMAKKAMQKYGGRWCQIDEYLDPALTYEGGDCPPIFWEPGDNNEESTRNRISELLRPKEGWKHPITGQSPAPRLYFIKRTEEFPYGCHQAIQQLQSQKREKIGSVDGKDFFSDDRDEKVTDHAYDPIRYYVASHSISPVESKRVASANSFMGIRKQYLLMKKAKEMYA